MNINNFDINIKEQIETLTKLGEELYPDKKWFINISFWECFKILERY